MTVHACLVTCTTCGIQFAVPREFYDERVADQRSFTCPSACKVRLGVESSTDRYVRTLGAKVDEQQKEILEMGEMLAEARLMLGERDAEIARMAAAIVHYELGPTAPVEGT